MDFAPWGSKSDARYPRGQGDTLCLWGWGSKQAKVGRADFFLPGMPGRYGIKSDAMVILWANSGITFDAMPDVSRVTAYDAKNAVIFTGGWFQRGSSDGK